MSSSEEGRGWFGVAGRKAYRLLWSSSIAFLRGPGPSVEILHHHDPLVVEVRLRVQNGFSVGRYRQALSLTVKGRD